MTAPKLKEAMAEAQRFIRLAKVALDEAPHYSGTFWGSKASGAGTRVWIIPAKEKGGREGIEK